MRNNKFKIILIFFSLTLFGYTTNINAMKNNKENNSKFWWWREQ